jgi:hypothetical protein
MLPRVNQSDRQIGMESVSQNAGVSDDAPDERWSMFHFSQSNPAGPGQGDVAALLRRVADSIVNRPGIGDCSNP